MEKESCESLAEARIRTKEYRDAIRATPEYAELKRQMRPAFLFANEFDKVYKHSKLTQAQIAKRMGTSQSRVSQIINNPFCASFDSLRRFFDACGMDIVVTAKRR